MTTGYGELAQSYCHAADLKAQNGHEYFGIACLSGGTPGNINSYVSLLDIETSEYYGRNDQVRSEISNKAYDIDSGTLRQYASTPDLISIQHAGSSDPNASFNLTFEPRGPNLYHGGSGIHWWGTGITNEIAYPQLWVTGTITVNNTETAIIPEESLGWMDRQWGPGYASNGWCFFNFYLPSGWVIAAWHTRSVDSTPKISSFATVLFTDGHHEVHVLNENIHETDSWVSADTNLTYYGAYDLSFPTLRLSVDAKLPSRGTGAMTYLEDPVPVSTLFEGYAEVLATLEGEQISGFGLVEQIYPSTSD